MWSSYIRCTRRVSWQWRNWIYERISRAECMHCWKNFPFVTRSLQLRQHWITNGNAAPCCMMESISSAKRNRRAPYLKCLENFSYWSRGKCISFLELGFSVRGDFTWAQNWWERGWNEGVNYAICECDKWNTKTENWIEYFVDELFWSNRFALSKSCVVAYLPILEYILLFRIFSHFYIIYSSYCQIFRLCPDCRDLALSNPWRYGRSRYLPLRQLILDLVIQCLDTLDVVLITHPDNLKSKRSITYNISNEENLLNNFQSIILLSAENHIMLPY